MTKTIHTDSTTIVAWLNKNGYIAYPKDVFIKGKLSDNFPIEVQLENEVRIAILRFDEDSSWILEYWVNNKHGQHQDLMEKILSAFGVNVILR